MPKSLQTYETGEITLKVLATPLSATRTHGDEAARRTEARGTRHDEGA